jgi:hypothetical protein
MRKSQLIYIKQIFDPVGCNRFAHFIAPDFSIFVTSLCKVTKLFPEWIFGASVQTKLLFL